MDYELTSFPPEIEQAVLARCSALAASRGIAVQLQQSYVGLVREHQSVRLNRRHLAYLRGLILRFDYYFTAVTPDYQGELAVVDCSTARFHHLRGFDDFPVYFPSYPEPMATTDAYLHFAKLTRGDIVLDLGAYAGIASILFSKLAGNAGRVISYEPDPENLEAAKLNLAAHQEHSGLSNVRLHPHAIWSHENGLEFSSDGNMGSSASQIVGKRGRVHRVQTVTLDGIMRDNNLEAITFIKMDIEGAEVEVIANSLDLLKEFRPAIVMESHLVNNAPSADICETLLQSIGYETRIQASSDVFIDHLLYARFPE